MNGKYRWHITLACSVAFGMVGLAIGLSIETRHPADRLGNVLLPTFAFLTLGLLVGYVTALVVYKRFRWFDAVASFAIPPMLLGGFIVAKLGDWTLGRVLGFSALGLVSFLVFRFVYTGRQLTSCCRLGDPVRTSEGSNVDQ